MDFALEMELKSDTLPGQAESYGRYISQEITTDKFGIPYIPARRIKGILRKNAFYLKLYLNFDINKIFGKAGMDQEFFRISNGYIKNYWAIRNLLKSIKSNNIDLESKQKLDIIFCRERIIDLFTIIRTQTKIENYMTGIAKEKSLRTSRLLKKGLKFFFTVNVSDEKIEDEDDFFEDLKKICRVSRHFGSNRNRGFGNINLKIEKKSDSNTNEPDIEEKKSSSLIEKILDLNDRNYVELNFDLFNTEPLIITPYVGLKNKTAFFIPGTMILGVLANKFIKINHIKKNAHENQDFKEIFLDDNVIFSNFYPIDSFKEIKNRSLPIPKSLYKLKYGDEFLNLINQDLPLDKNFSDLEGFCYNNKIFEVNKSDLVNLNTSVNYHFQSSKDKSVGAALEGEQNFFQYESIDPDYHFSGKIYGKSYYIKKLLKIFKEKNSTSVKIQLGKSRSAQYGNCILQIKNYFVKNNRENRKDQKVNRFIIYLESDMILLNSYGHPEPNPKILIETIENKIGIEKNSLEIHKQYINKIDVGGFSGIWGLPKIQYPALKKGCILLIESKQKIEISKIKELHLGIKTNEGFGKIQLRQLSDDSSLKLNISKLKDQSKDEFQLQEIKEFLISIFDNYIIDRVNELAYKKSSKYKRNYSISELTRLKTFIIDLDNDSALKNKFNALSKNGFKKFKPFHKLLYLKSSYQNIEEITFNDEIKRILTNDILNTLNNRFSDLIKNELFKFNLFKYYKNYYLKVLKILEWNLKKR